MKYTIVCCLIFVWLSESKSVDSKWYTCPKNDEETIKFTCETREIPNKCFKYKTSGISPFFCKINYDYNNRLFFYITPGAFNVYVQAISPKQFDISSQQISSIALTYSATVISHTITTFNASHNELNAISSSISIPNLITIDFSFNQFRTISSNLFFGSTKLIQFSLAHNQIFSVNSSVFSSQQNLEDLNLSRNQIATIDGNFRNNKELKYLNLSNNRLTSLNAATFDGAHDLTNISLANNIIQSMDVDTFSKLGQLQSLDLSSNNVKNISENLFAKNNRLKFLDLRNNIAMTIFNFNAFPMSMTTIEVHLPSQNMLALDVSCRNADCLLKDFEDGEDFRKLQSFIAAGNRFRSVSRLFNHLGAQLELLDLSNSHVGTLNGSMLHAFGNLRQINLSNASVSEIAPCTFCNHLKLHSLDISDNHLKNVTQIFGPMPFNDLETLNLEGNDLTSMDNITAAQFPKLVVLKFSMENFACEHFEGYLKQWKGRSLQKIITNGLELAANIRKTECQDLIDRTTSNIGSTTEMGISTSNKNLFQIIQILAATSILLIILIVAIICIAKKRQRRNDEAIEMPNIEPEYDYAYTQPIDAENVPSHSQMQSDQNDKLYAQVNENAKKLVQPDEPMVQADQLYAQVNKTPKQQTEQQIGEPYAQVNKTPKNQSTDEIYGNM